MIDIYISVGGVQSPRPESRGDHNTVRVEAADDRHHTTYMGKTVPRACGPARPGVRDSPGGGKAGGGWGGGAAPVADLETHRHVVANLEIIPT